jgi:cytochrome c553
MAANGVVQSRHNLGAFGSHLATRNDIASGTVTGTTQICVFCHTPHHSNTDARPLWNRNMPNSASYIGYGTTIAGTVIAKPKAGSASLACLSCHDGVTTFDNLVNAPGKGTAMVSGGWTFYDGNGKNLLSAKVLDNPRVILGTDLTNDHPVNVPYSGGTKASLRPMNTTISSINLSAGLNATTSYFTWVTANNWAISGFISSTATIGDLLRSDNSSSNNVECSSCHDPHFDNGSYPEYTRDSTNAFTGLNASDGVFLRRVGGNMGSGVCRTCHNK